MNMWRFFVSALLLIPLVSATAATKAPAAQLGPDVGSYLTFEVDAGRSECVYEELKANDRLELWFEVVRGDSLDIKFKLLGPGDKPLLEKESSFNEKSDSSMESEGHITQDAKVAGIYSICFDNTFGSAHKVISLYVHDIADCVSQLPSNTHVANSVARIEHLGPMWDATLQLQSEIDSLERSQHHMRVREQAHRDTAESTNTRVAIFTFLESLLLLAIAAMQLHSIRTWFSDKEIRRPSRV